jgi:hypothetical protein
MGKSNIKTTNIVVFFRSRMYPNMQNQRILDLHIQISYDVLEVIRLFGPNSSNSNKTKTCRACCGNLITSGH